MELPDAKAWALRQLVSHRRLLVKQRVAVKNTVLATFHRCLICPPEGDVFSARGRSWMRSVELPPAEHFLVHNGLELLEATEARLDATDQQLLKTAAIEEQARLLMTIPGVGVTALARKLIVLVWYMLQNGEPYRYASVETTRRKLRSLVPKNERTRTLHPPRTLEEVYREAELTLPPPPSHAERRAAANNRRTRTRLSRTLRKQ